MIHCVNSCPFACKTQLDSTHASAVACIEANCVLNTSEQEFTQYINKHSHGISCLLVINSCFSPETCLGAPHTIDQPQVNSTDHCKMPIVSLCYQPMPNLSSTEQVQKKSLQHSKGKYKLTDKITYHINLIL